MSEIQKDLSGILRKFADGLDAGNTTFKEKELEFALDALRRIAEPKLSKYQAARYLNLPSTKKFDYLVSTGRIRKGRKEAGFKEIFWYKSDLKAYLEDNTSHK